MIYTMMHMLDFLNTLRDSSFDIRLFVSFLLNVIISFKWVEMGLNSLTQLRGSRSWPRASTSHGGARSPRLPHG